MGAGDLVVVNLFWDERFDLVQQGKTLHRLLTANEARPQWSSLIGQVTIRRL